MRRARRYALLAREGGRFMEVTAAGAAVAWSVIVAKKQGLFVPEGKPTNLSCLGR